MKYNIILYCLIPFARVLQEHTELALALSTSLAESHQGSNAVENFGGEILTKKTEPVKNAYAILMSPSNKAGPQPTKRGKKKCRLVLTCKPSKKDTSFHSKQQLFTVL